MNSFESYLPTYEFTSPATFIFLNGAPLTGKSTIAPQIAATIKGCGLQHTDVLRLVVDQTSAQRHQMRYGACEAYQVVGDGSYSPQSLVTGFRRYTQTISPLLGGLLPELGAQSVSNVLFEGVQLSPEQVAPYLTGKNLLILLTANSDQLLQRCCERYGTDHVLLERYAPARLWHIQNELIRQARELPSDRISIIASTNRPAEMTARIIDVLRGKGVISPLVSSG